MVFVWFSSPLNRAPSRRARQRVSRRRGDVVVALLGAGEVLLKAQDAPGEGMARFGWATPKTMGKDRGNGGFKHGLNIGKW